MAPLRATLATDLDGTLVDHADSDGGRTALQTLFAALTSSSSSGASRAVTVIYNTGRSPTLYADLAREVSLPPPDVLICSVGTEVLRQGKDIDETWEAHLDEGGWDAQLIRTLVETHAPSATPQQASEQRKHKLSWKLYVESEANALADAVPSWARVIFSTGEDLDVVPSRAGKGNALAFVLREVGADASTTLCCGDSGNDVLMLGLPDVRGCVVGNAAAELVSWFQALDDDARQRVFYDPSLRGATAILAAMKAFELLLEV